MTLASLVLKKEAVLNDLDQAAILARVVRLRRDKVERELREEMNATADLRALARVETKRRDALNKQRRVHAVSETGAAAELTVNDQARHFSRAFLRSFDAEIRRVEACVKKLDDELVTSEAHCTSLRRALARTDRLDQEVRERVARILRKRNEAREEDT
jgi:hypothetical protein